MKKLMAIILSAVMVLSLLPFAVSALNEPESIRITTLPEKLEYYKLVDGYYDTYSENVYDENGNVTGTEEKEYFVYDIDAAGLVIEVTYPDGTTKQVNASENSDGEAVVVQGQSAGRVWGLGTHNVTVSFMGKETAYEIEILENPVKSIEIEALPDKLSFYEGVDGEMCTYIESVYDDDGNFVKDEEKSFFKYDIDFRDGFKIKVNNKDGSSATLEGYDSLYGHRFNIIGQDCGEEWEVGMHEATVEFMGATAEYMVGVMGNPVESIEIASAPDKTVYYEECGGVFDYFEKEITDNEGNVTGTQQVKYYRYILEEAGLAIKVNKKDGTSETLVCGYPMYGQYMNVCGQCPGNEIWGIGKHNVTVSFMGKTASFEVEVAKNPVESIEISQNPEKLVYYKDVDGMYCEGKFNYAVDLQGYQLKINYSDGTSEITEETEKFKSERINITYDTQDAPWEIGENRVTVEYMSKTAAFSVELKENPVNSISFSQMPKQEYILGEVVNLTDAVIHIEYTDSTSEDIAIAPSYSNDALWENDRLILEGAKYNLCLYVDQTPFNTPGEAQVKVRCAEKEITFDVNVENKRVISVDFTSDISNIYAQGTPIKLIYSDSSVVNTQVAYCNRAPLSGTDAYDHIERKCFTIVGDAIYQALIIVDYNEIGDVEKWTYRLGVFTKDTGTIASQAKAYTDLLINKPLANASLKAENLIYNIDTMGYDKGFIGVVTAENIDALINLAFVSQTNEERLKKTTLTKQEAEDLLKEFFAVVSAASFIEGSSNYNAETDTYQIKETFNGFDFSYKATASVMDDGNIICEYKTVDEAGEEQTKYVVYNTQGKIVSFTGNGPEVIERLGDVDGDTIVNSSDALLILQHSTGLITLSEAQLVKADVDADSVVNSSDSLLILQYSTGLKNF